MSDAWDGRPENPEREGAHVLDAAPLEDGRRIRFVALWANGRWHCGQGVTRIQEAAKYDWQYVGPCHTPQEVAALVREAEAKGVERGAEIATARAREADSRRSACWGYSDSEQTRVCHSYAESAAKEIADAITALAARIRGGEA